jgi:hypothetical protein
VSYTDRLNQRQFNKNMLMKKRVNLVHTFFFMAGFLIT